MWRVIRASAAGASHTESNLPCQDECYAEVIITPDGTDYLVCLVSDGAGSAQEGGKGAALACKRARSSIESVLLSISPTPITETVVEGWITDIRRAIFECAEADFLMARDYACTFLGAVLGHKEAIFFQIGDGAIIASAGPIQGVVFWPDSGLYANMTHFITEEDVLLNLQVCITSSCIDEVALFSDGIQRLALSFEQRTPHHPFFEPMFSVLRNQKSTGLDVLDESLARFLNSHPVNQRTDDDKTLVLATRLAL